MRNPPNPASTRLFQTFKRNAPAGLVPNGPTVQGVYCMTADGDYLSGYFAWAFRDRALRVIQSGWDRWQRLAEQRGYQSKPIPVTPLPHTLGNPVQKGGVKLQVAVRDLPRGREQKPGNNELERCAHNLSWIDLPPNQAAAFVTNSDELQLVPQAAWKQLALRTLKDCVRGQCGNWRDGALSDGAIYTQRIAKTGSEQTMRLTGYVVLTQARKSYTCQLHGQVVYDEQSKRFKKFEFVAAGQRRGRDQFNSRQHDMGPAPMGVAFKMHHKGEE